MEEYHATNADASMVENTPLKDTNESDAMDIDSGDGEGENNRDVKNKGESQLTTSRKLEACIGRDGQRNRKSMKRVRFAIDDCLEIERKSKKMSECNSTLCNMEAIREELIGENQFRSKRRAYDFRQSHNLGHADQPPKFNGSTNLDQWGERGKESQNSVGLIMHPSEGETSCEKRLFFGIQGNGNTSNFLYHEGITKDESSLKRSLNVLGTVTAHDEEREESSSLNHALNNESEEKPVDVDFGSAQEGAKTLKEDKTTSLTLDSTIKAKPTRVVRRYRSKHTKSKDDGSG